MVDLLLNGRLGDDRLVSFGMVQYLDDGVGCGNERMLRLFLSFQELLILYRRRFHVDLSGNEMNEQIGRLGRPICGLGPRANGKQRQSKQFRFVLSPTVSFMMLMRWCRPIHVPITVSSPLAPLMDGDDAAVGMAALVAAAAAVVAAAAALGAVKWCTVDSTTGEPHAIPTTDDSPNIPPLPRQPPWAPPATPPPPCACLLPAAVAVAGAKPPQVPVGPAAPPRNSPRESAPGRRDTAWGGWRRRFPAGVGWIDGESPVEEGTERGACDGSVICTVGRGAMDREDGMAVDAASSGGGGGGCVGRSACAWIGWWSGEVIECSKRYVCT